MPCTRLIDTAPPRRDDEQVLSLIQDLPAAAPRGQVFTAGLLNEVGLVYREVELYGEYEALQFTARMNSRGFVQLDSGSLPGYTSIFCKP